MSPNRGEPGVGLWLLASISLVLPWLGVAAGVVGMARLLRGEPWGWQLLVLGAGMIANVAVERAAHLYPTDPEGAAALWSVLHAVEQGLGGGNEIAGGFWLLSAGIAGWFARTLPGPVAALGVLTGIGGLATLLPPFGDAAGAIFGLGAIAWFVAVGTVLLGSKDAAPA